jgi:hypothetical protein
MQAALRLSVFINIDLTITSDYLAYIIWYLSNYQLMIILLYWGTIPHTYLPALEPDSNYNFCPSMTFHTEQKCYLYS